MKPYYSADGITLYQGHNQMVLDILGLNPEDVALLWGDPPYGISKVCTGRGPGRHSYADIAGDDAPFDPVPWLDFSRVVLWGANHYASRLPPSAAWWCWDKKLRPWETDQADVELAWTNLDGVARCFRHLWHGGSRESEHGHYVHPTQKPVALAAWGFQQAKLKPGDLVLSPWLGSGPEAVAARDMGLRFIGVELVTEYLDACVARLRQRPLPLAHRAAAPEQAALGLSLDSPPAKR